MFRLLILGNINNQLLEASKIASKRGAKVTHVADIKSAMQTLRGGKGADLIMAEISQDIASFIQNLEAEHIAIPVVACGLEADKEKAVAAIKAGAKEYISLPPEEEVIAAIFETICNDNSQSEMIGVSEAFVKAYSMASKIAESDANVLITGESGTGKEGISRMIHKKSKRRTNTWIALNCAAIPENLMESEMFGHEKGAFTGAIERRIGKFEEANGGTLLLDEISEMPITLQAKLLRALQEKEITRVGGNNTIKTNVRIIATSNRNLQEEVRQDRFRADLYYRLNVINIQLPSLRERSEDIEELAKYFVAKYSELNGIARTPLTQEALDKLKTYSWPGNVRELENTIHRAVLLESSDQISAGSIMLLSENNLGVSYQDGVPANDGIEQQVARTALNYCSGDYDKAATVLGASLKVLRQKLKQHKNEVA
ncbi:MAG: sigma-54-dependent Fis family transcriptional regulator [Proteobacteria bacterium]|nr:sigma-54-dependent Fis family transcriptional regulator [Pseudomonadota bacterium]